MQTITTCRACHNQFTGKYCNNCGEKVYTDHDKSVFHFVEEGIHFVTHFEGTFFTTLKYLFTGPGKLSENYCYGIRKSLFKPLSLFFLLVIIYLLFPVFEGLNMRLYYHTHHNVYSSIAMQKAAAVMQKHHWTDQQLTEAFHQKSEKVSKFLLLILLPLTAVFFYALTFKKRRYFFDQMVFATEINSVYLIWGFMLLPLLLLGAEIVYKALAGHYFQAQDDVIGIILYAVMLLYVTLAMRRFYQLSLWKAIGFSLLFYIAHYIIVQIIYKFLLFLISISLLS
ncbi:MAG: DUF3667 domain-containing protein [Chitinophagaceae bacterium]|nr:MAG: DUF3667 domain-containing protein [Chitinophagaceae bacterium]